jgi:VWFA-related protein
MNRFFRALLSAIVVLLLHACGEMEDLGITPRFSDLSDNTTDSIQVTLPRVLNTGSTPEGQAFEVYITVTDQDENLISHLNASNFALYYACENGETVCLERFAFSFIVERIPMALAITMDYSGSMSAEDIQHMETAVREFVQLLEPFDEVQIIKFSDSIQVMNNFTSNQSLILDAIDAPFPTGSTAFIQSIYEGLHNLNGHESSSADHIFPIVIAFTDGGDNSSTVSLQEVMDLSVIYQVPVYTVGLGGVDHTTMSAIAKYSGARYYFTPTSAGIIQAFQTISSQVSNFYRADFVVEEPECGQMEVTVDVTYRNALGDHQGRGTKTYIFP